MEQIINIRETKIVGRVLRGLQMVLILGVVLVLTGCVPLGDETVNTELFKNREEVTQRTDSLHKGMSKKKVFEKLNVNPSRFERMSVQDVQMAIYGNSQVRGTPEQLEAFKRRLAGYEGYALPYRNIKADSTLGFGSMKITKQGCDLKLVLIFDRGKLIRSTVEGTQSIKQVEDENLWPSIIKRGIGFAF
jgi:hypothetical protein